MNNNNTQSSSLQLFVLTKKSLNKLSIENFYRKKNNNKNTFNYFIKIDFNKLKSIKEINNKLSYSDISKLYILDDYKKKSLLYPKPPNYYINKKLKNELENKLKKLHENTNEEIKNIRFNYLQSINEQEKLELQNKNNEILANKKVIIKKNIIKVKKKNNNKKSKRRVRPNKDYLQQIKNTLINNKKKNQIKKGYKLLHKIENFDKKIIKEYYNKTQYELEQLFILNNNWNFEKLQNDIIKLTELKNQKNELNKSIKINEKLFIRFMLPKYKKILKKQGYKKQSIVNKGYMNGTYILYN